MKCLLCGKHYKHLGSHLWHAHKVKAREYKMEYGLDLKFALIDDEIKLKKQEAFKEKRELYLKNLRVGGKKYQFKKGHAPKRTYFSEQSMDRAYKNLKKINQRTPRNCPICNQRSRHLPSHLYNAHGLLVVHKDKYNETIRKRIIQNSNQS